MDWQTLALGVGTIFTGVGGCSLAVHEFRKRDRKALTAEADVMGDDLAELRQELLDCRRYAYDLAKRLIDEGIDIPDWQR